MKQHTFKFRTGDTDEKGGCTFIGEPWVDKTTDELFKGKKIVLFSLLVHLHQHVQVKSYQVMIECIKILKQKVLMMYIAYQ